MAEATRTLSRREDRHLPQGFRVPGGGVRARGGRDTRTEAGHRAIALTFSEGDLHDEGTERASDPGPAVPEPEDRGHGGASDRRDRAGHPAAAGGREGHRYLFRPDGSPGANAGERTGGR